MTARRVRSASRDRDQPSPRRKPASAPAPVNQTAEASPILRMQRLAGNESVNAALRDGPASAAPSSLLVAMRAPAAAAAPAASTTYEVGGVTYRDDEFQSAIQEIANLVDGGVSVLEKRKAAVAEFCGDGGAGAKAEASFTNEMLTAVLMGLLAFATDGLGTVVMVTMEAAVASIAHRIAANPEAVLSAGKAIIHKSVDFAKDQAKERIPKAVNAAHDQKPTGGTELANPLATYMSALNESLDADGQGMRKTTVQQLLRLPAEPVRWAVAAALWESLHSTLEQIKTVQWNATSDGWFSLQTSSGIDRVSGLDRGIVSLLLGNDAYPQTNLTARNAYLGGSGANEATVRKYNERKLGDVHLVKRLIMDSGSLGRGLAPCGWEVDVSASGDKVVPHSHTRWGDAWLAAKHLGLRDLDSDAPQVTVENVKAGAEKVWAELRDKSAKELGASFDVLSMLGSGSAGMTALPAKP